MIRDKKKIYGEANDERTVTKTADDLVAEKFITKPSNATEDRVIATADIVPKSLLVLNNNQIEAFNYNSPNKIIGTDDTGNLGAYTRIELPDTPPSGRVMVAKIYGSTQPDGIVKNERILLTGPYWYEVEVAGCGGGGGGGAAMTLLKDLIDGKSGGPGGYCKSIFAVKKDTYCTATVGCPGGGATGYIVDNTEKSFELSQGPNGGDGGYTPVKYYGVSADSGQKQSIQRTVQEGGTGEYGGANGGTVYGWKASNTFYDDPDFDTGAGGAGAGGGTIGAYGGAGGDSGPYNVADADDSGDSTKFQEGYIGGAGGAGAGFGQYGGAGGAGWYKSGRAYGNGGKGYGGGGGGGCANADSELYRAGCGGGGGGGARFVCNDLEILCGGGGGGCGGGDIVANHIDGRHTGGYGRNNKNYAMGGGGAGGAGGKGVQQDDKVVRDTSGTTGSRGWITIWRCE